MSNSLFLRCIASLDTRLKTIRTATWLDTGKLVLLGAIWGSSFFSIEIALNDFSPLVIAAFRIALAAVLLLALALHYKDPLPQSGRDWLLIVVIGFFNSALPFVLIGFGQRSIDSGTAATLMASGPFMMLILSHFFTRDDRFTLRKLISLVCGFSGILVLVSGDIADGDSHSIIAQLAVVAAACCYAGSSVLARHLAHIPPRIFTTAVLVATASYLLPVALLLDAPAIVDARWHSLAALLYLGAIPTGLAYLLRFQLIQEVGTTFISQVSYLVPLFGVFWGWLLLNEVLSVSAGLALLLIFSGLTISRWKTKTDKKAV